VVPMGVCSRSDGENGGRGEEAWQGSGWPEERDGRAQRKRRENMADLPCNMVAATCSTPRQEDDGEELDWLGWSGHS